MPAVTVCPAAGRKAEDPAPLQPPPPHPETNHHDDHHHTEATDDRGRRNDRADDHQHRCVRHNRVAIAGRHFAAVDNLQRGSHLLHAARSAHRRHLLRAADVESAAAAAARAAITVTVAFGKAVVRHPRAVCQLPRALVLPDRVAVLLLLHGASGPRLHGAVA